jgi:hypothetical protein
MNIYILYWTAHWYDTYDSCIVCAENEEEAKKIYPSNHWEFWGYINERAEKPEDVSVEYIWLASEELEKWLILSSFNTW